jgi:hypothetical protein
MTQGVVQAGVNALNFFFRQSGIPFASQASFLAGNFVYMQLYKFIVSLPFISIAYDLMANHVWREQVFPRVMELVPTACHAYAQVAALSTPHNSILMWSWLAFSMILGNFPVGVTIKDHMNSAGLRCPELLAAELGFSNFGVWQNINIESDNFIVAQRNFYSPTYNSETCGYDNALRLSIELWNSMCPGGRGSIGCVLPIYGADPRNRNNAGQAPPQAPPQAPDNRHGNRNANVYFQNLQGGVQAQPGA